MIKNQFNYNTITPGNQNSKDTKVNLLGLFGINFPISYADFLNARPNECSMTVKQNPTWLLRGENVFIGYKKGVDA